MARWWNHEVTYEAVERDFGPSADGAEPNEDHIVLLDGRPVGLIQYARYSDYPDDVDELAPLLNVPDSAVSIDYLIGDASLTGRGLGTAMIDSFARHIWRTNPVASCIVVPVCSANEASWRALLSAGFRLVARGPLEPDNPIDDPMHEILRLDRLGDGAAGAHGRRSMSGMSSSSVPSSGRSGSLVGADLDRVLESHRRELTGYCYRMLGAASEAEDAVQETMVRAWRAVGGFEGRSSMRSWLYRIATNVCVDMHRSPQRRARPMEMGPATRASDAVLGPPLLGERWVHPVADERVIDVRGDPAHVAATRETIRLAFVAALQHLPARQRASLILCEVLGWQAAEVADLLDTTVASVNSALQRARSTVAGLQGERLDPTVAPQHRAVLARYVDAFERYDIDALVELLRNDVVLSMPPYDLWMQGSADLAAWFLGPGIGCRGGRLVPVDINGSAGFGNYRLTRPGLWEPFALQVIEVAGGLIVGHHNFLYPERFAEFGLPARLEG